MTFENDHEINKRELILQVTLAILEEHGLKDVTIRKIASSAQVNIGLINYYFGSKEKLIITAIQKLVHSAKGSFDILDNMAILPRERLRQFLIRYLSFYEQHPFVVRMLLDEEPVFFEGQKDYLSFVGAIGLQKVKQTIREMTGDTDPEELTMIVTQVLGAAFTPTLIGPLYEKITGLSFPEKEKRIDFLIDCYFAKFTPIQKRS